MDSRQPAGEPVSDAVDLGVGQHGGACPCGLSYSRMHKLLTHRQRVDCFDGSSFFMEITMPQGEKSAYTDKQKRQARHIEQGYEKKGVSESEAEARAWASVNKTDGGGKKSGAGKKKSSAS